MRFAKEGGGGGGGEAKALFTQIELPSACRFLEISGYSKYALKVEIMLSERGFIQAEFNGVMKDIPKGKSVLIASRKRSGSTLVFIRGDSTTAKGRSRSKEKLNVIRFNDEVTVVAEEAIKFQLKTMEEGERDKNSLLVEIDEEEV